MLEGIQQATTQGVEKPATFNLARGAAASVESLSLGEVPTTPHRQLAPPGDNHFFSIHEESLIKSPGMLEQVTAHQIESADDLIDLSGILVIPITHMHT